MIIKLKTVTGRPLRRRGETKAGAAVFLATSRFYGQNLIQFGNIAASRRAALSGAEPAAPDRIGYEKF
jgi:hypothetical protein